ncbi:MAG: phosphogluconate dehydrogenase C-terminal domain-containing protein [Pirellulales bacterium]|nr:phosphogluconate dehydrogenase C-terminal domain-containing protein [Pirellulales bacterium]
MTRIAIFGAGGKMGCRLTDNLLKIDPPHQLLLVENHPAGQDRVAQRGMTVTEADVACERAEVAILALPDKILGKIAAQIIPRLRAGTIVMTLDPAAAHAGELPARGDITYFVTHPCHPDVFDHFETARERDDFFGGVDARQAIVCALLQGPEEHYTLGEELAKQFYGPVTRSHRITVEQMAILEPTMAETCGIALVRALREALEETVRRGVPRAAAEDFMYGHIKVELGIAFGRAPFPFSDGAQLISSYGQTRILQPDWLKLFEPESVLAQTRMIVSGRVDD